jgi:multisubunit Na+/H+ antiporter MnhB subunit
VNRKRHPFRGFVAGLLLGLGVSIMLLIYGKVTTESGWPVLAVTGAFAVIGVLVGLFGPTRGRRSASAVR